MFEINVKVKSVEICESFFAKHVSSFAGRAMRRRS
jgi:hypothetical protein